MGPFGILSICSIVKALGETAKPLARQVDAGKRYNEAARVLREKGLNLAVRTATLADNAEHMERHATRMTNGGFNLADPTEMADFCEDMRVQLRVGDYADQVFREHGSVCQDCGHTITSMRNKKR